MIVEIKIPVIGESITEGFIVEWMKGDGEFVNVDDNLYELETDKITMTIQSEHSGQLKIIVPAESEVDIGQVVASIDTDVQAAESAEEKVVTPVQNDTAPPITPSAGMEQVKATLSSRDGLDNLSPAVRRLVVEKQIDPTLIKGTGKGGRIIKDDVLKHLENISRAKFPAILPERVEEMPEPILTNKPVSQYDISDRQTRKPMSRLRQRLSERLVNAQQTAAILTTFNEADMSAVIEYRKKYKDAFLDKYGLKLGFMSFFVKATVEALKRVPAVNAQIDGNDIVYNNYYDIGVAVSTDSGLVVPVIRDADKLSFGQIEQAIAELGKKARERKLTLDDLQGGTFTISNGGIFGSMMSTPILNSPQSAILGMHAIKNRAVVVEPDNTIEVRPMMYLAVSYDHRLIDGAESVTFLKHIVECLENPERIMFEV
ncbi:MAG TPA: 2-oxoglutarate dehydrogenase complex dihydrolipoyllysine-residue succinyltransferase [Bacteroidetes bacterium]|nr:dihydrolipoyllysine-residue succinyltransferase component of 2-oxoglutarate dehydrogenase complex [bacterium BMS3Bbin04]HDO65431.1 2-oxoglutarate dehydrogenase complex dihydrolipoyllysine-residue succinyltransferase [Bacteroidota bacterium]HEX04556.1 2-oxoglutarate dehydrogenase complex dihydrolipoyllysine-residue succinyltransferase [Bacteroidota bacterium]